MDKISAIIEEVFTKATADYEAGVLHVIEEHGIHADKERLKKALTDAESFWQEGYEAGKAHYKEEVERYLRVGREQWISVNDRLPEQYMPVLVYMPDERPFPRVREGYLSPDG